MSRNRKTVQKGFNYKHADDFAAYLSDMASKGWHLKEWGAGLVFERGEPEQTQYAVEVFIDGTEYDTRPERHTQEFAEYCEAAGWKLVDAKRKFCIFKKISEDAVPILTAEERIENTAKALRGNLWYRVILCATWVVLQYLNFFGSAFVNRIFSNELILISAVWVLLFIVSIADLIHFYWWKRRLIKELENGKEPYFGTRNQKFAFAKDGYGLIASILFLILMGYFILSGRKGIVVCYLVIFSAMVLLAYCLAKFRPQSDTNQIIQICFSIVLVMGILVAAVMAVFVNNNQSTSLDGVPVSCEDLGIELGERKEVTVDGASSIFGNAKRYWLEYEDETVYYQVYETDHAWILDRIWDECLKAKYNEDKTDCTKEWHASLAYRNRLGTYYIRYPDMIIIWNGDSDIYLSDVQIQMLYDALYVR